MSCANEKVSPYCGKVGEGTYHITCLPGGKPLSDVKDVTEFHLYGEKLLYSPPVFGTTHIPIFSILTLVLTMYFF
ncbi:hypothetical protein JOC77_000229 [Peribacillus deserti]|uniref:Uncharacterized protein n=1 Tax=Peribacillus deserti TaxID=673318 RepID=A0ABS2QCE6_9BACI|nr:hypothetical protein [Peribacillus deserti]